MTINDMLAAGVSFNEVPVCVKTWVGNDWEVLYFSWNNDWADRVDEAFAGFRVTDVFSTKEEYAGHREMHSRAVLNIAVVR